jgi:hypothetical protein
MTQDPVKLTVEIKNQHPVELVDLTQSLLSFADEYKRISLKTKTLASQKMCVFM